MSACHPTGASAACAGTSAPPRADFALPEGADALRLSPAVIDKVAELLAEEGDGSLRLRIFVTGGGCSGFQYGFAFDDAIKADDLCLERGPVRLVVDAMSLQYLNGAEIDYQDDLAGARFVIRNPNATSTCGCGSSFSV